MKSVGIAYILLIYTPIATVIKLNDYPISKYGQPGQAFIYTDQNSCNLGVRSEKGNLYVGSLDSNPADNNTVENVRTQLQDERNILSKKISTDVLITRSRKDITIRAAYAESSKAAIVHTDGTLNIYQSLFTAPEILFMADAINLSCCGLNNKTLLLQSKNPHSVIKLIVFVADEQANTPILVHGYIDFRTEEPMLDLAAYGVKEVHILFADHAFQSSARELASHYSTHMACLLTAVAHTNGPILELGAGDYSTPLLHAVCSKNKRHILTTDTDRAWLSYFTDLENEWHTFTYVDVYEDDWEINPQPEKWDAIGEDTHWSVVFVDHRPGERRIVDIVRLRDRTDIFVVHDTDEPGYNYEPLLNSFKYRYVDTRYTPETMVLSDTIDVSKFFDS